LFIKLDNEQEEKMQTLELEFEYFNRHKKELIEKYADQFIVIKGTEILGAYKNQDEAITESLKKHTAGTFLVQFVSRNEKDYIQKFHSRVSFDSTSQANCFHN
jgi:hypothetical protein